MTKNEFEAFLIEHPLWRYGGGNADHSADLRDADLSQGNLRGTNDADALELEVQHDRART